MLNPEKPLKVYKEMLLKVAETKGHFQQNEINIGSILFNNGQGVREKDTVLFCLHGALCFNGESDFEKVKLYFENKTAFPVWREAGLSLLRYIQEVKRDRHNIVVASGNLAKKHKKLEKSLSKIFEMAQKWMADYCFRKNELAPDIDTFTLLKQTLIMIRKEPNTPNKYTPIIEKLENAIGEEKLMLKERKFHVETRRDAFFKNNYLTITSKYATM